MPSRPGRSAFLLLLACVWAACGGKSDPPFVDVDVAYVSRLPQGTCPEAGSLCYAGCAHSNAPAGLQAIVTLWDTKTLRLEAVGPGRYEGTLVQVPTNTPLRLYGRDIGMCCVDACNYPPVLEDILLNGTKLTHVVREGLPVGVSAALEFRVESDGTIRQ
jgi:hypothetical protein